MKDDIAIFDSIDSHNLIEKINQAYDSIQSQIDYERHKLVNISIYENIKKIINSAFEKDQYQMPETMKKRRHIDQDIAIAYQMIENNLLCPTVKNINDSNDNNNNNNDIGLVYVNNDVIDQGKVFVELGAGKGMLGLSIIAVEQNRSLTLVERGYKDIIILIHYVVIIISLFFW